MTTATVQDPWKHVSAARLAVAHIAALAPVRDSADVRVFSDGESAWVSWPAGKGDVVRCLLPVPGVEFFTQRDGRWFQFGSRLPTAERPPSNDGRLVSAVLFPARFELVTPAVEAGSPVQLRVVHG